MPNMNVYWGDMHDNVFQHADCPVTLEENFDYAQEHLDFYAPALYVATRVAVEAVDGTTCSGRPVAIAFERWREPEQMAREWAAVQEMTRSHHQPGAFVTFPGYEWQGDGRYGDHNVVFREEGGVIDRVLTLPELYAALRGKDAIAIPHHTAYEVGARGKDWSVHDETLSPFVEVFSVHGCSETDEEWIGLRRNTKMGPGIGGSTYQDALDRGLHVGAMCSTDGMGSFPGRYNWGLMACLAPELTRDALWDAFLQRRVYGVTGDRIELAFHVNDAAMGSRIAVDGSRDIRVSVTGSDALDRVEVLRNGQVVHTYCHQGTWRVPAPGQRRRFKVRIETGWGPFAREVGPQAAKEWRGTMTLPESAHFLGCEPCWISAGQSRPSLDGNKARFTVFAPQLDPVELSISRQQNANVFEFEADASDPVAIDVAGMSLRAPVADLCAGSRVLWDSDGARGLLETRFGIDLDGLERPTINYLYAHKAKLHRCIPEAGYTAAFTFVDDEPLSGETNYRVRVEQRNGQRAWSSPVWVRPASA